MSEATATRAMARPSERQSDWKPEKIRNRKPASLWKKLRGKVSLRLSYFHTPSKRLFLKHVSIRGVELVVPANEDVGRLIAYLGNYEPDETDFLIPSIRPDDICFDVGANIGYYTMLMARAASSGAVHAFEPDPFCAALLQLNLRVNRLENVTLNPVVLGASRGRVQFVRATDSGFNSLRDTGRRAVASTFPVTMDTLDACLDATGAQRVDVLKIDVEGAEGLVLEGARQVLSDPSRRPRLILLELFDPNQRPFGSNVTDIVNRLGRSGYTPFVVSEGKPTPYSGGCASRFSNVFFYAGSPSDVAAT